MQSPVSDTEGEMNRWIYPPSRDLHRALCLENSHFYTLDEAKKCDINLEYISIVLPISS